ncbi:pentapeptide repeat-containing protein [Allokutzneria albata]|uniref:pentapeptide repeat-containing protein n=1 Tax=Allokutzneria albata TaxID=211114 RepID=UPI0012DC8C8C|nr:pentapeptide repeat-containing protein [Allokutzneria albata]
MREESQRPTYRVLSTRTIVLSAIGLVTIGFGVVALLLFAFGGGSETDRVRLDVIKTAGTVVVGTGGAAALLLAARRQRTTEIALQQKDIDQAHQEQVAAANQAHQERVATATEADAAERRVTELYTKAVEQLGSDKAPVRLGGMYALERLAQNVPEQRQTIVNVLCAYLRMPYAPVAVSSASVHDPAPPATGEDAIPAGEQHSNLRGTAAPRQHAEHHEQERQVRLTAQRILTAHLNTGNDPEHPVETFWPDIDLDLTGATLLDFDFTGCRASNAHFTQAQFHGGAGFHEVIFDSKAGFNEALFHGDVQRRVLWGAVPWQCWVPRGAFPR